jgi:hypothetical protein
MTNGCPVAHCFRLPGHVFRLDQVRDDRAQTILGPIAVLRPLHLRTRGRQQRPPLRARRGLRTPAQGQPQVQALGEDEQDRALPRLLPGLRVRGGRQPRVPGDPDAAAAERRGGRGHRQASQHQTLGVSSTPGPSSAPAPPSPEQSAGPSTRY